MVNEEMGNLNVESNLDKEEKAVLEAGMDENSLFDLLGNIYQTINNNEPQQVPADILELPEAILKFMKSKNMDKAFIYEFGEPQGDEFGQKTSRAFIE